MLKRVFDILSSTIVIIVLLPIFIVISISIILDSKGGVFYRQIRIGKNKKQFKLFKFRTMKVNSDKLGQLTVGAKDSRITKIGFLLRKYKLDEFPQLLNVILGEMSIVGPRPEVPKYVAYYSESQLKVLGVRPGLTDLASIEYINENEILGNSDNPEEVYLEKIMPNKLLLNIKYIETRSFLGDFRLIFRTIKKLM